MKVIFLDVDGVLNSLRNVIADGGYPYAEHTDPVTPQHLETNLDRLAIGMIRKLCEEYNAQIVLHSTWRMFTDPVEFGKRHNLPIIDGTNKRLSKPDSIKLYLNDHPEIECFIVIDDDDMEIGNRQVWTFGEEGFIYHTYTICQRKLAMKEGKGLKP